MQLTVRFFLHTPSISIFQQHIETCVLKLIYHCILSTPKLVVRILPKINIHCAFHKANNLVIQSNTLEHSILWEKSRFYLLFTGANFQWNRAQQFLRNRLYVRKFPDLDSANATIDFGKELAAETRSTRIEVREEKRYFLLNNCKIVSMYTKKCRNSMYGIVFAAFYGEEIANNRFVWRVNS